MAQRVADQQSDDPKRREATLDQTRDDIFIVRWLHGHALINFFRSMCRPLVKGDLFNLTTDLHPQTNVQRFRDAQAGDQTLSLVSLLFRKILIWEFLLAGLLAMITAGLAFAGPLVIKEIMNFLKIRKPTSDQQATAYGYAGLWIGLYLLRIFVNEYADRLMFMQAVKAEQILTVEVHHKITRLSPSYRAKLEKGDLMNYLTIEIKLVFNFIRSCGILFSAPSTLIVVQAFLFKEVGLLGFVLLGILIIVACIQLLLNYKLSQARRLKLKALDERMNFNLQVFSSIKEVKTLGWEDLIINKNRQFREKQNSSNQRYYTLANVYDLVINLSPTLTVFIIFLIQILTSSDSQFDTAKIYTVLSFVGMTYGPTKSLLNTIVTSLDGTASLKKISTLLRAEQVQEGSNLDSSLQLGEILIKDFFEGSWQTKIPIETGLQEQQESSVTNLKPKLERAVSLPQLPQSTTIQLQKRSSEKYVLRIPNSLRIKSGDKYIIMGESDGGKSTLLHAIMGNLNRIQGDIKYSGKVGYLPQKLWFRKATVKQNILFGLPFNKDKLKKIYRIVMLANELPLLTKGEETVIKDLSNITDSQKRRIALARVLYSQPDILLLDSVFSSIDPETASEISSNLYREYSQKTIIIASHNTELLKPMDNLILMKDGKVEQIGKYSELLANKTSYIHQIIEKEEVAVDTDEDIRQRQIENDQKITREKKLVVRRRKVRSLVKYLISISRGLSKQQIEQQIIQPAKEASVKKEEKAEEVKRIDGVPGGMYLNFFKSASLLLYLLVFFLSMVTQGTKVFADWWIGSLKTLPWKISDSNALYIYIGLTAAFGLFFAIGGFISPCISVANTETIADNLCSSLATTQMTWFEGQNTLKVAGRVNRDNEEIFGLNSQIQNIFRSALLFIATVTLVGYNAPTFFGLAGGVIILDVLILFFYMREERQMSATGSEFNDPVTSGFDEAIQGTDILRAFGKLEESRSSIFKSVYLMEVYKVNYKFIGHGMSMLTELTSLMVIAGAAFFAVSSNSSTISKEEIAIIGTSISFSLKMTGIMVSIIKDSINLEIGIKGAVQKAYDIIGKNQEADYDQPVPPTGWPANNSIKFVNTILRFDGFDDPVLQNVSFEFASGENIVVCGKGGKGSILLGACKQLTPVAGKDGTKGMIMIGGVDLQDVGRKCKQPDNLVVAKKAMLVSEVPFLFTGTVRENMDPRNGKSDEEIRQVLTNIGVWDELPIDELPQQRGASTLDDTNNDTALKLQHVLVDAGSELSLGLQQKISLARALLYKPSVLMLDGCTSSLDKQTEQEVENLLREKLKTVRECLMQTTIVSIATQMDTAVESDLIIYMTLGMIREIGKPIDLLKNPDGKFSRMVRSSNPELYQKLTTQLKKGTSSLKRNSKKQ